MKTFLIHILQGIIIGIANIIPGISGSTLAVILGIYEKIINIITKFDIQLLKLIRDFNFQGVKKHISLNFLISISIGIISSYMLMANLLEYLFEHFAKYTWSYFFGIIGISSWYVSKYVKKWNLSEYLLGIIGFMISLAIFLANPHMGENQNLFFVFLCGSIGVLGMLIPGLSGSYLLVLLGNYELLMSKILIIFNPRNIQNYLSGNNIEEFRNYLLIFIVFLLGHVFSILLFSRSIKWLISKHRSKTFATLTGFIIGSLLWIWPWKHPELNILKTPDFNNINDVFSFLLILLGFITIIGIEHIGRKYKNV